jgi:ribosomal protein L11 methyltransferase
MAFWQIAVPTSAETSEGLTNFLWELGALGVVEEVSSLSPPRLRAFFPDSASSVELAASVKMYADGLRALGFPTAEGAVEIAPLLEEAWASAWQQSFPPRAVGRRLWVKPPWETTDAPGRVAVVIEPGRAFGTGHHGSTEGCLALLDDAMADTRPDRVLDIGTGTGILAVAAVVLGAGSIVALDVDPDAIAAARVNASRNGCAAHVELVMAGPESLCGVPPFPLILANLLAHTHVALAPHYRRLAAPGGAVILGGILEHEDTDVIAALEAAGFEPLERLVIEGWSSLLMKAPAA